MFLWTLKGRMKAHLFKEASLLKKKYGLKFLLLLSPTAWSLTLLKGLSHLSAGISSQAVNSSKKKAVCRFIECLGQEPACI